MMRYFCETECVVRRLKTTQGKGKYSRVGEYLCYKRQMDAQASQLAGLAVGNAWQITMEHCADVRVTDILEVDGVQYRVSGVREEKLASIQVIHAFCSKRVAS